MKGMWENSAARLEAKLEGMLVVLEPLESRHEGSLSRIAKDAQI